MSEAGTGGSGGPGWLFSVGAFVCLVGPLAFGRAEEMRFEVRLLTEYLSLPFALTSGFLALSTRKPRSGGAALWLAALLWLGAVFWLMVPIRGWAMNRRLGIDVQLGEVQTIMYALASLALAGVAVRAAGGKDGWTVPLGVRITHVASLLLLVAYLARGTMMFWAFHFLSVGTGLAAIGWELGLAHYVGLVAAGLMALSVGARHVLREPGHVVQQGDEADKA